MNYDLKQHGLKVTQPRLRILKLFEYETRRHFSAEEIYQKLLQEGSEVSMGTVYRVLNQFETAGIILRSNFGSEQSVYELNDGQHHDHVVCVKCQKVEEFFDEVIEKRQEEIISARGGRIVDHSLCIYVECEACQGKASK